MAARILSISYDLGLLRSRQLLLQQQGYLVDSTTRFDEAVTLCKMQPFDLVVIGHSIPEEEKRQFITELRSVCSTPVLALIRPGDGSIAGANYDLDVSDGPKVFTATVRTIVTGNAK